MITIPDNFCGYVNIAESRYVYCVNGHIIKLLPAVEGENEKSEAITVLKQQGTDKEGVYEYIYGHDESLHQIALLLRPYNLVRSVIGISFFAPIIIKSKGNADGFYSKLTKDWKKYDAITFSGGIINSLYNPKVAALKIPTMEESNTLYPNYNGARFIEIKPFDDYTHRLSVLVGGQKAKLVISVSHSGDDGNINTTDLGSLKSFIQLQFEVPQDFITIHRYIQIINETLAVLSRQSNICFDVCIKQKTADEKYMETGICKVFMDNEDIYNPQFRQVIQLGELLDYLPKMIDIVSLGEAETILALLPQRNKDRNRIHIANVQDLCTALEAEYNSSSSNSPSAKDTTIQQLKDKIKVTIKTFTAENAFIDTNKETTVGSCFQYLDLNLKSKIFALYEQNKTAVDGILQKYSLPEITLESIDKFVKLRNTKIHTGKIVWSDSADLYMSLVVLTYSCFFTRVGVPSESLPSVLSQVF